MNNLHELRKQLDLLDIEIVAFLDERVSIAETIGKVKNQNNMPFSDLEREKDTP